MPQVTCTFLGYPQVKLNHDIIEEFISTKALVLACYLILHPHKIHVREILATYFWGEMPEKRAKANLRQALHNIQKMLPECFEVTRQSVQVVGDCFTVDINKFEAINAIENADADYLLEGISYYRGEFLEGLYIDDAPEIEDWLRHQRERYRLIFLDMLENLSHTYFSAGEWATAEKYYRRMLEVEPWQEHAHRQVMVCLARQGKFARAQAYYQTLQDEFFAEFGTNLTFRTRFLHEQIQHAQEFAHHQPKTTPHRLIAREDDVAYVKKLLFQEHVRLVTIFGMGGVGKTHLVRQLMHQTYQAFLHGVIWVDLTASQDLVTSIYGALIDYHYVPELKQFDVALDDYIIAHIENYELLLVLDNLEHLVDDSQVINRLLEEVPAIKILTTSRRQLTSQWEYIYHLRGLKWVSDEGDAKDMDMTGAMQLFVLSAQQIRHDFVITPDNRGAVNQICGFVEGLPLALRLVASWIDHFTPAQIVKHMQQNMATFVSRAPDVSERHLSISSAIASSLELLNEDERQVLLRLAIFRSSFELTAALYITEANLAILSHLVKKSLVLIDESARQMDIMRYRLHELVRQYLAAELQTQTDRFIQTQQRFNEYYLQNFPTQLEQLTENHMAKLTLMHTELDNLHQAWWNSVQQEQIAELSLLTKWLRYYYGIYGYWRGYQFFQNTLNRLPLNYATGHFAHVLKAYSAFCLSWIGQYTKTRAVLEELQLYVETHHDEELVAHTYFLTGHLHAYHGDNYIEGAACYKQALNSFRDSQDDYHIGWSLVELGRTYAIICRTYEDNISEIPILQPAYIDQSLAYLEEARISFQKIEAQDVADVNVLHMLGYINYLWGRDALAKNIESISYFHKAIDYFQQIIHNTNHLPGRQQQCGTLNWLGIAYVFAQEDISAAQTYIKGIDCSIYYQRLHTLVDVLCNVGKFFHRKQINLHECAQLFAFIEQDKSTDARIRKWSTLFLDDTLLILGQFDRVHYFQLIRHATHQDIAEQAKRLLKGFIAAQKL